MKKIANILLFLLPSITFGSELSGYFKLYPTYSKQPNRASTNSISGSVKAQYAGEFASDMRFETSYELSSEIKKHTRFATSPLSYRAYDFNRYLHHQENTSNYESDLSQNLNRFNVSIISSLGDFIIGRTPVALGVSKSISPNDILTPFALNSIDKEERTGVDTIIYKNSLSESLSIEIASLFGDDLKRKNSAYYVRPKFSYQSLELSSTIMEFKNKNLLGIELTHPIKDAGFWIDYGYVNSDDKSLHDYSRITTGIDYKFQNTLYLSFEYHFNGATLQSHLIYSEDFIFLRDSDYTILTSTYEFTPLLLGTIQSYYNVNDSSMFLISKLEYNITENSYISAGSLNGISDKDGEFYRYGKTYWCSYRYYY